MKNPPSNYVRMYTSSTRTCQSVDYSTCLDHSKLIRLYLRHKVRIDLYEIHRAYEIFSSERPTVVLHISIAKKTITVLPLTFYLLFHPTALAQLMICKGKVRQVCLVK